MRPRLKLASFVPKEYDEQCAIFSYAQVAEHRDPRWRLLFCTLNGVRLPIGLAQKMKRAGNRTGVPDLILPVARGGYFGWFGEGKRIGGKVSDSQSSFIEELRQQGYRVDIWYGARHGIELITEYLALPPTRKP